MLVPNKNPRRYKEHVISFISFSFGEGAIIIEWIEKIKVYLYNIKESYKYIIIGHIVNSGPVYLLLHIVQFWRECALNE